MTALIERVQATRRTTIERVRDGAIVADALTYWVWVGLDGRPKRLPAEIVASLPRIGAAGLDPTPEEQRQPP